MILSVAILIFRFLEDMEAVYIRHSFCLQSQLSQEELAVAAGGMLAHMCELSGQSWQISSACLRALGPGFAAAFLWLFLPLDKPLTSLV